jgi:hypothetical protein
MSKSPIISGYVVKGQVGNISAIFMARKVFLVRKKV